MEWPSWIDVKCSLCSVSRGSAAQVEVVQRKQVGPPGSTHSTSLFTPPMSLQRHAFLAALMDQGCLETVVDLGCGEASLFRHLLARVRLPPTCSTGTMISCKYTQPKQAA